MTARVVAGKTLGARGLGEAGRLLTGSTGKPRGVNASPKTATPSSSSTRARGAGSSRGSRSNNGRGSGSGSGSSSGSGTKRRLEDLFTDDRRSSSTRDGIVGAQGFQIPIEIEDDDVGASAAPGATATSTAAPKRRRSKSPFKPVGLVDLSGEVGASSDQPLDLCDSDDDDAGTAVEAAAASRVPRAALSSGSVSGCSAVKQEASSWLSSSLNYLLDLSPRPPPPPTPPTLPTPRALPTPPPTPPTLPTPPPTPPTARTDVPVMSLSEQPLGPTRPLKPMSNQLRLALKSLIKFCPQTTLSAIDEALACGTAPPSILCEIIVTSLLKSR